MKSAALLSSASSRGANSSRRRSVPPLGRWGLHVGLLAVCIVYALLGAVLFRALERPERQRARLEARREREHIEQIATDAILRQLRQINESSSSSAINRDDDDVLDELDRITGQYMLHSYQWMEKHGGQDPNEEDDADWSWGNCLLFTATTLLPVGYGFVTPITPLGRALCCLYALVGVPLVIIAIGDIAKFGVHALERRLDGEEDGDETTTTTNAASDGDKTSVFLLLLLLLYLGVSSAAFSLWAEMSPVDAVFFTSSSILTIGFGDAPPPVNALWLVLFLTVGVLCVSMTIEHTAVRAINYIHFWGRQLHAARRLAVQLAQMAQRVSVVRGLAGFHQFARLGLLAGPSFDAGRAAAAGQAQQQQQEEEPKHAQGPEYRQYRQLPLPPAAFDPSGLSLKYVDSRQECGSSAPPSPSSVHPPPILAL